MRAAHGKLLARQDFRCKWVGETGLYLGSHSLLAVNYHTKIDSISAGGFVYTVGMDSMGYYSADSAGTDTTCLYLDGYVDQNIQVAFFFMGKTADTLFVTVSQTLRYDTIIGDSADVGSYDPENTFAWGFEVTDTLFYDDLNTTKDTLLIPTVSHEGTASRMVTDWFECIAPGIRINIRSKHNTAIMNRIHIELYARHRNDISGGASGRQPRTR